MVRHISLPGGIELACRLHGDGAIPVVFLHGYTLSHESWERVLPRLPPAFRAYAYDMRGFGRSGRADSYGLKDHAQDVLALMDALGLKQAALVGHSLGGTIAQMAAARHPQRILALVLSNARARNQPPPDAPAAAVAERIAAYDRLGPRAVLERRMPDYFDPSNLAPGDLPLMVERALQADVAALKGTLASIYGGEGLSDAEMARIAAPVLFVAGETDQVTPASGMMPALDVLPCAEFASIAGAGHSTMWERPDAWSEVVYEFLTRACC